MTIRLDQAEIICLDTLERQASQGVVAAIATDISEVVVLQVLTQLQKAIRRGQLSRWLPRVSGGQGSKTLNDIDELGELAALVVQVVIYRVIPQLRPEVESLVAYSVDQVLRQAPPIGGYWKFHPLRPYRATGTNPLPRRLAIASFCYWSKRANTKAIHPAKAHYW